MTTEELLGRRLQRFVIPFRAGRNIWMGPRTPPVRGWLVQQLAKLALTRVADNEVLVHADSDIVLTRRFRPDARRMPPARCSCTQSPARSDSGCPIR